MTRQIKAKKIVGHGPPGGDSWFGTSYTMNLYRGCSHGCIYCDSRSSCYHIDDFDNIQIKSNAIDLLHRELKSKRRKGTIGFGSMNDCYMPLEESQQLTRKALEIVAHHRFPVHIITKSTLVVRDIDLLKKISSTYAAVSITITTTNDDLAKKIEPFAPPPSQRLNAIKQLRKAGIYTGITFMPVLPFITDTKENIIQLVDAANEAGAAYILATMGMTNREGQRDYFYQQLDKHFPGIKEKYITAFGDKYNCNAPNANQLWKLFTQHCQCLNIPTHMKFYNPNPHKQLGLFE